MKIVFDALGAPAQSGGMRLHATQLISSWVKAFPADEVHVVAPAWAQQEKRFRDTIVHRWPNESVLTRGPGQFVFTAYVARRIAADAVVSLSPIVTPLSGRQTVAFQHDWRHIKNPDEFSRSQRLYRALWRYSARWAGTNACISEKTIRETLSVSPGAHTTLIPNGYDDAASWEFTAEAVVDGQITTFGHHNNKRPELMIKAMPHILEVRDARLIVLGANGAYKEELARLSAVEGVSNHVLFPGFVTEAEYQRTISASNLVALVSSDEGFGLPIAEAAFFGIPALITDDSGMGAIFEGYPTEVAPDPLSIAHGALRAMTSTTNRTEPRATPSWASTVQLLRDALQRTSSSATRESR